MPEVIEDMGSLACVKCQHPVTFRRVGDALVAESELHDWRNCKVFHLEHWVRKLLTQPVTK